jgi:prepilin-type N-terminal cleavage/methylation domain-containing protein
MTKRHRLTRGGFTLIELSIVLVIIGLLVGAVLVGQSLISAAALRAQITQIEKYNTAVNTFRVKYDGLPGDLPNPYASSFGFVARGTQPGQGDGNGVIEGGVVLNGFGTHCGYSEGAGETATFWEDLSTAKLIEGNFNTATSNTAASNITATSTPSLSAYVPEAKLGGGNYVYVWSGGYSANGTDCTAGDGHNYFGVSNIGKMNSDAFYSTALTMTVSQAFAIDKKMDDGLPQSGNVIAIYLNWNTPFAGSVAWAAGGGTFGAATATATPTTAATPGSSTTCYDNANSAGAPQQFSMQQNNGNGVNCALSFRFQ